MPAFKTRVLAFHLSTPQKFCFHLISDLTFPIVTAKPQTVSEGCLSLASVTVRSDFFDLLLFKFSKSRTTISVHQDKLSNSLDCRSLSQNLAFSPSISLSVLILVITLGLVPPF